MNATTEAIPAVLKILVVDDDPTDLKLSHTLLKEAGHEVIEARDAERALSLLKENRPNVILIDLELPGMNGMALARQLKRLPSTAEIPIIAVTAYPEPFSREAASDLGFSAYFVKPINTRTMVEMVVAVARKGCAKVPTTAVLVADDNATNRKLLRAVLEAEGYGVSEVSDGREALAALQATSIPSSP